MSIRKAGTEASAIKKMVDEFKGGILHSPFNLVKLLLLLFTEGNVDLILQHNQAILGQECKVLGLCLMSSPDLPSGSKYRNLESVC